MKTSNTLIRISGPVIFYLEVKYVSLTNDWENIAYWEVSEQNGVLENKFDLS